MAVTRAYRFTQTVQPTTTIAPVIETGPSASELTGAKAKLQYLLVQSFLEAKRNDTAQSQGYIGN